MNVKQVMESRWSGEELSVSFIEFQRCLNAGYSYPPNEKSHRIKQVIVRVTVMLRERKIIFIKIVLLHLTFATLFPSDDNICIG